VHGEKLCGEKRSKTEAKESRIVAEKLESVLEL
jgi:hypothetical protein